MPSRGSKAKDSGFQPVFGKASMIDEVHSTKLPNGITVLSEHMPGLRSVTAGIWVRRGSRHESAEENGICHFIEHSVFKGTERRSARDIAVESDRLGGQLDAYTTHEMIGFALKVADSGLAEAFDLVADIVSRPRFDQQDLEREQKVVLEEMKMVEDTPDELLGELFNAAYFPDQPLGRPIEGTEATVSSFNHVTTAAFHARAKHSTLDLLLGQRHFDPQSIGERGYVLVIGLYIQHRGKFCRLSLYKITEMFGL